MKKGIKILLGALGLGGLGLLIWGRIGQTKRMINNLQVFPMLYGGINDMDFDPQKGIKLPIAVDIMNRSDASCKIRINSINLINKKGDVYAYSAAGDYVEDLKPNQTTRIKNINVWIKSSYCIKLFGVTMINIISFITTRDMEKLQNIANKALKMVEDSTIQLSLSINEAITVSLNIPFGESAEVSDDSSLHGLGLVCAADRKIRPLSDYNYLIPDKSNLKYDDRIILTDVEPEDTAKFIRKIARQYKSDTSALAKSLKGDNVKHTTENIWNFVADHIQYVQDASDKEQVRRPLRTLYDQKGDCDCYTTLIASMCENLGLDYVVRIAEYDNKGYFQHVYCIIEGYVCDPVVDRCFYEKKPTRVKDF